MPPEEEPEVGSDRWLEIHYPEEFSRTFAGEMARINERMRALNEQIMTSMGISVENAARLLSQAMRTDMPRERRSHSLDENGNPIHHFIAPYQRTDIEVNPAALQQSTVDPELLNRVRSTRPPLMHDLRRATGYCGRCNQPAVARCYTVGCMLQGVKVCAKHLHEDHDGMTLPEGVPHG